MKITDKRRVRVLIAATAPAHLVQDEFMRIVDGCYTPAEMTYLDRVSALAI